jgi:superkiller protein 3
MSATKTALKAAKAALDAHKYEDAVEQVRAVIALDSSNYNANVFLGLAYEKQGQNENSEAAYRVAIKTKGKDPLAWQGLVTLYEKQANEKLDPYHDTVIHLAELYMERDDRNRCQAVLDKYTNDAKKYGSRAQLKRSLEVYLPTGPLYEYLEGRVPQPALTYAKIADLTEAEEKERINTDIGQRRTRLGAKIDEVTADVKREVLESSQLEDLYGAVIDWTHDDDIRRQYEEKLLQHAYDTLVVSPVSRKAKRRQQVIKLAEGLVILKHPFLVAWQIKIGWEDVEEVDAIDVLLLRDFIELFPNEGLAKVLLAYLGSDISPFPQPQVSTDMDMEASENSATMSAEDRLILMSEGIEESSSSILAHRLVGLYYLYLEEYESAAVTAREGQRKIQSESNRSGSSFERNSDAVGMILATALVHFQAPRHHPEASEIFENILRRKPTETSALLGVGLILEEQEDYAGAVAFLSRALQRSTDPKIRAEAAWCKSLNGDNSTSLPELEACLPEMEGDDVRVRSLRAQTLYRIGMCIWNQDESNIARKSRDGAYARFLASLQADLNYAPAYTSLGVYYADYAKDKKRARKCFQKAFELSSSEIEAAERLAKSFAKSSEWDLVEVVAQRVIDSGRAKPAPGSKKKAVSWPFAALGVTQLNNQEYAKSIVSFLSALRTAPADYDCWVGLGESYHSSGRYVAATKALEQAQRLEDTSEDDSIRDNWFSKYMLANVKRELGEYDDAIAGYQAVLKTRPSEFGVSVALLQSLVEGAWHSVGLGFFGRAADAAKKAISVAHGIVTIHGEGFNLWKAVGDACSVFTYVQAYASTIPLKDLHSLLTAKNALSSYDLLADIDGIGQDVLRSLGQDEPDMTHLVRSIHVSILAQKRAIYACANDIHARAVAWYNLGWTEYRAQLCESEEAKALSRKDAFKHLKAAVQCFKRAIELEAGNAEFWNSLGIVTADLNPKVSQHSFVRSLHLNDKSARVWTNLGTLYLINEDRMLANEAYTRAQSTDPDYAQAWVGQGLLAAQLTDANEARTLFAHAFEIAGSSSTIIKRQYAVSTFDHLLLSPTSGSGTDVLQPLFALHQLRSQLSTNLPIQHLTSLFAERIGDYRDAISNLDLVASRLEADYETSESSVTLLRFAQAKTDLARSQLAEQDYEAAAENAETALSLSEEEDHKSGAWHKVRLSAHMTGGLGYYHQGMMDQAIAMFRSALEETQGNPDIVCLLVQMLWAKGGEEERNVAREQLIDCLGKNPGHADAITLLGAIAVINDDRDTVKTVTADLHNLRTRDNLSTQQMSKVGQLITAIAVLFPENKDGDLAELSEATTAVMLAPSKPHGWLQLASLSEDVYPAEMAVITATKAVPPGGTLDASHFSRAHSGTRRLDGAQRAIMVAPWVIYGWEALTS